MQSRRRGNYDDECREISPKRVSEKNKGKNQVLSVAGTLGERRLRCEAPT